MRIQLDLRHHCIETATRKLYNQSIARYFKPGADTEHLEKQIGTLKTLLENGNFNHLRSTYGELAGHSTADVAVVDRGHGISISLNGRRIPVEPQEPSQ